MGSVTNKNQTAELKYNIIIEPELYSQYWILIQNFNNLHDILEHFINSKANLPCFQKGWYLK